MDCKVETVNTHHFEAFVEDEKLLKQFKNGNIRLYSLKNSFTENVMWRIRVQARSEDHIIDGEVEKLMITGIDHHVLKSEWKEANAAVRGAITNIYHVNQMLHDETDAPKVCLNLTNEAKGNIAFTLSGSGVGVSSNEDGFWHSEDLHFQISTWDVRQTRSNQEYVHGLMTLKPGSRFPDLVECAQTLETNFGRKQLTWLQYCTNPAAWKQYNRSNIFDYNLHF